MVETGVDKGLGSCVLAAALLRNRSEGYPGFYFGTDINPSAGWLFQGKYKDIGQIFYGDSIESLQRFEGAIDLFINDSDHSAEYEQREYACIQSKLSARSVLLGDNAHVTDALYNFALDTGRRFLFFLRSLQIIGIPAPVLVLPGVKTTPYLLLMVLTCSDLTPSICFLDGLHHSFCNLSRLVQAQMRAHW